MQITNDTVVATLASLSKLSSWVYMFHPSLAVYFIEWPGVVEAALKDVVYDSCCMSVILASGPVCDGQCGSPPHTLL